MTISVDDERLNVPATHVQVTEDTLRVELEDGRTIAVPILWYPRLTHGTQQERNNFEIGHYGIHWPDLDEDISIKGLLLGNKSGESQTSLARWLSYRKRGKKVPVKTLPLPEWAKPALKRSPVRSTRNSKRRKG